MLTHNFFHGEFSPIYIVFTVSMLTHNILHGWECSPRYYYAWWMLTHDICTVNAHPQYFHGEHSQPCIIVVAVRFSPMNIFLVRMLTAITFLHGEFSPILFSQWMLTHNIVHGEHAHPCIFARWMLTHDIFTVNSHPYYFHGEHAHCDNILRWDSHRAQYLSRWAFSPWKQYLSRWDSHPWQYFHGWAWSPTIFS